MFKYGVFLIFFLVGFVAVGQTDSPFQLNGFVDSYHAVRLEEPNDWMSSRTRFRGELRTCFDHSSMFVSFNVKHNALLKNEIGFELREAYLDYTVSNWDLRIGRQIIIWGTADGVQVTDLISPKDLTEFLARDYDDIRMPVEAIKLSHLMGKMKIELVYVPLFSLCIIPSDKKNPWAIQRSLLGDETVFLEDNKPPSTLKNSEYGGRILFNLPSIDVTFSALHTFNKKPVYTTKKIGEQLFVEPHFKQMTMLGTEIAKPLGEFVVRLESAFYLDKAFVEQEQNTLVQSHNLFNSLIGVDWYAPKEWLFSFQYNYEDDHALLTANISKKVLNSTLQFSNFIYYDLTKNGCFNRFSVDYALTDQINILIGCDLFQGKDSFFGQYKHNSECFAKAKFSF